MSIGRCDIKSLLSRIFWRFIRDKYPDVKRCSQILPCHVRDYIPHTIRRAREVQRGPGAGEEVRPTAHSWLVDLRVFFSDLCAWATEPDSPFKRFAPLTIPATRHTFLGYGFEKARERTRARITATVLDLERDMPKIRAFALQDGTDDDAKPIHSEWTGRFDGKDYPVIGDPNFDARSYTVIDDRTLGFNFKKGGKLKASGRIEVSTDGKSRTVTMRGIDAKGKKVMSAAVYDKQ